MKSTSACDQFNTTAISSSCLRRKNNNKAKNTEPQRNSNLHSTSIYRKNKTYRYQLTNIKILFEEWLDLEVVYYSMIVAL